MILELTIWLHIICILIILCLHTYLNNSQLALHQLGIMNQPRNIQSRKRESSRRSHASQRQFPHLPAPKIQQAVSSVSWEIKLDDVGCLSWKNVSLLKKPKKNHSIHIVKPWPSTAASAGSGDSLAPVDVLFSVACVRNRSRQALRSRFFPMFNHIMTIS